MQSSVGFYIKILIYFAWIMRRTAMSELLEPNQSFFGTFVKKFDTCVASVANTPSNFLNCIKQPALSSLQEIDDMKNYTFIEGLNIVKVDTGNPAQRSSVTNWLDQDPTDFRSLMENFGAAMSQRAILWDMAMIYPGLQLKVGPSYGSNSVLEFMMDPSIQNDERGYIEETQGTARILTKKFVIPFLLGLKFNLAALLPIFIGIIILLSKKTAFLAKMVLVIINIFGAGGLFAAANVGHSPLLGHGHGPQYGFYPGAGFDHYKSQQKHFPRSESETQQPAAADNFYEFEKKKLLRDRSSRLYERELDHGPYFEDNTQKFTWH